MTPPPAAAAAETLPRTRPTRRAPVRHPRRVSGPAHPAPARPARPTRPTRPIRPASRAAGGDRGLALRVLSAYERIADSSLLDRLVRGRLWIGLLAFALIGIVAMQLVVLKLNEGIGTTLAREAALQRANAQLGIEAATGSGEAQIAPLAAATGMTFAPSGSVHFVASSPAADVAHAASVLAAPIAAHETPAAGTGESAAQSESAVQTSGGTAETSSATNEPNSVGAGSESGSVGVSSEHSPVGPSSEASSVEASSTAAATPGVSAPNPSSESGATGGAEAGHG